MQKEKHLETVVLKILPKQIADCVCQAPSHLAHLYGHPETHKEKLSLRPILSVTGTYNFALAKSLDEKLKPLSANRYTITDTFSFAKEAKDFAKEIQNLVIDENGILVSYDVPSQYTNVPLQETIESSLA